MLLLIVTSVIILLTILDAAAIFLLLVHHAMSNFGRSKRAALKNRWKEIIDRDIDSSTPLSMGEVWRPSELAAIGEVIREKWQTHRAKKREALVSAFEKLSLPEFYAARLSSKLSWRRGDAALALGEAGQINKTKDIAELLNDPVRSVRLKAATGLAYLGTEESLNYLLGRFETLDHVGMQWLKDALYTILRDKPKLVGRLLSEELPVLVKKAVLETASDVAGFKRADLIARLASDENEDIELRISAVKALGTLGTRVETVKALLASSPCWELRAAAANALGMIGSPKGISALEKALTDKSWWVRINSAKALARLGSKGIEALKRACESTDRFASDISTQILDEMRLTRKGALTYD